VPDKKIVDKTLRWIRNVENAALSLTDDILLPNKVYAIIDTSIIYGKLFPSAITTKVSNLILPNRASPVTVDIHAHLGNDSPIIFIIPPYTAIEIIHLIKKNVRDLRKTANNLSELDTLIGSYAQIGSLSSEELAMKFEPLLKTVPTGRHKEGIRAFNRMLRGPNVRSCSGVYGKNAVIEAHRRSEKFRERIEEVFLSRTQYHSEDEFDFLLRNTTDADNLANTIELNRLPNSHSVIYAGPIPLENHILSDDLIALQKIQRNYLYPYLLLSMYQENLSISPVDRKDAIHTEAKMLSEEAKIILNNIPSGLKLDDLTSSQLKRIVSFTNYIANYSKYRNYTMEEAENDRDQLRGALATRSSAKEAFVNHAEYLDTVAMAIVDELDDLNDEDILDEFSIRELRENVHTNLRNNKI